MKSKGNTIVQLADYGGPYSGNFIASLKMLSAKLNDIGWRQIYIFSDIAEDKNWLKELINSNHQIYFLPRNKSKIVLGKDIYHIVKKEKASILHTHFSTFDMPSVVAKFLRQFDGENIHCIRHVHSAFPVKQTINRRLKDLIKFTFTGRYVDSIYVSDAIMDSDVDRGLNKATATLLGNGIDIDCQSNSSETRECLLHNYQIQETNNNLLLFGWDPITKGVDITLKACLKLAGENNKFNLIIIGEEKLNQYVDDFFSGDIPAWLKVLGPEENVSNLYQIADIFISSSRYEGFSYAVLEAMVRGLPIVCSDIPGLIWAREAPLVNFFISENISNLSEVLQKLMQKDALELKRMFSDNRDFVVDKYSMQKWTDKLLDIYSHAIKGNEIF